MSGSFSKKSLSDFSARTMYCRVSLSSISTSIFLFNVDRMFRISLRSVSIVMDLSNSLLASGLFNGCSYMDFVEKRDNLKVNEFSFDVSGFEASNSLFTILQPSLLGGL